MLAQSGCTLTALNWLEVHFYLNLQSVWFRTEPLALARDSGRLLYVCQHRSWNSDMPGQIVSHCTPQLCNTSHESSTDDKLLCKRPVGLMHHPCVVELHELEFIYIRVKRASRVKGGSYWFSPMPAGCKRLHKSLLSGKKCKLFVGQWHREMHAIMDAVHSQFI